MRPQHFKGGPGEPLRAESPPPYVHRSPTGLATPINAPPSARKAKRGFDEIDRERLDVAEAATSRLLSRFKSKPRTTPADRRRLELLEEAASALAAVRLIK